MRSLKPLLATAILNVIFWPVPPAVAQQAHGGASPAPGSGTAASSSAETTVKPAAANPEKQVNGAGKDSGSIHVEVNEVIVPVSVTDEKGRFVSDLEQKDFQIFEDNRPQTIRYFTRERNQPVVIGFLLDLSNASHPLEEFSGRHD